MFSVAATALLAALCCSLDENEALAANNLVYNGGPTMQNQIKIYLVYWLPPGVVLDTAAADGVGIVETLTQRFFEDVSDTQYLNIATQYPSTCGAKKCALANGLRAVVRGGAWVDTRTYPHAGTVADPLQDSDIQGEVSHAIAQNNWAIDSNTEVFVVTGVEKSTGAGIEECTSSTQCTGNIPVVGYCAYHSSFASGGNTILYGFLSDASFNTAGCGEGISSGPNGQLAADREVALMTHEFMETVTDPLVNANVAWLDSSGNEIGDKCNQVPATVRLGSRSYVVQQLWSNASSSCVSGYAPSVTPNVSIWRSTGTPCSGASCPGWQMLDDNAATVATAASSGALYQLQSSGKIWLFNGLPCAGTSCPSWQMLDSNPAAVAIAAGSAGLYQLHNDGSIWMFTGTPCSGSSCPGWQKLDDNPAAIAIAAGGESLYQLHGDGTIWRYTGTPCASSCPGWQMLDKNTSTVGIVAAGDALYQTHIDGTIWHYTGTPCSGSSCPGWQMLDDNAAEESIAADAANLYQMHVDGTIWRYTGKPCSGNSCPGWQKLDSNSAGVKIAADAGALYQLHNTGQIWLYTGTACNGSSCPGWQMLDENALAVGITAGSDTLYQQHSNLIP